MVGIPGKVAGNNLKTKMLPIFQKVGCTIETDFSDNCHCLLRVEKIVNKSLKSIKTLGDNKDLNIRLAHKSIHQQNCMLLLSCFMFEI